MVVVIVIYFPHTISVFPSRSLLSVLYPGAHRRLSSSERRFEVTGNLEYVLPVMIGVMFSKWVGNAFGHQNIASAYINLNQLPFLVRVVVKYSDSVCVCWYVYL